METTLRDAIKEQEKQADLNRHFCEFLLNCQNSGLIGEKGNQEIGKYILGYGKFLLGENYDTKL